MSKIIRTSKPSVLPWYAAALVFAVLCAVLPVYKLWALLAALGGACAAFGAAKKFCPPRVVETEVPFHTGVDDVDAMLTEMQKQLDTLHALNEALPEPNLSAAMTRMEKAGRSIAAAVEQAPDKARSIDRFARYYLPEVIKLMTTYANMEKNGVKGGNADQILTELRRNAATTAKAFENQLDALYSAEAMDISTDIEVLDSILKSQNLAK